MLYGRQSVFGAALTPSQQEALQRRKEAAARVAEAARVVSRKSEGPLKVASPPPDNGTAMTAAAFFAAAWRMLDTPAAVSDKPVLGAWPVHRIQEAVCAYYQVSMSDLISSCRSEEFVRPRQVAMYLSRILTGRSLPEIGKRFGARRHTTVLHAARKITKQTQRDAHLARDIDEIISRLRARGDRSP